MFKGHAKQKKLSICLLFDSYDVETCKFSTMITVRQVTRFSGHAGPIYTVTEGHQPEIFYTGSADKMLASWNLHSLVGEPFAVRLEASVYSTLFIPEKNWLLVGQSKGGLHVIDLESKQEIRHFTVHQKGIFDLAWSAKRERFYAAGADGNLSVWQSDPLELERHIPFSDAKLRQLALSPEGDWLAVTAGDALIHILDTEFLNEHHTLEAHDPGAHAVAWHPEGKWLLTGGRDAHLDVWHIDQGFERIRHIPAHNFPIYAIAFSPNGKYFATASRDKTVKIWNAESCEVLVRLDQKARGHRNSVNALYWSKHHDYLVSVSDDHTAIAWEIIED